MSIKRGDRLVLTIKGISEPVVALLDEHDGSVMVRARGGVTAKRGVKHLRADVSSPTVQTVTTITEDGPDLSNVAALCPMCRESSTAAKFAGADSNLRIFRARLVCRNGHEWEVEVPNAPRGS